MKKLKIKIYTLGCKVNQYDSADLIGILSPYFATTEKAADLAVVNTCSVTKSAVVKGKQMLNKARRENPQAILVLMGCWPKSYDQETKSINVGLIWPVGDLQNLKMKILNIFKLKIIKETKFRIVGNERTRYFIKIQDGCEQFCSYCIIPYNRGRLYSRSQDEIIKEINEAIKASYKEIVLSGIHLGLYGQGADKKNESNLVSLIKNILQIKDFTRLRLSSIEITEVTDDLIKLLSNNKNICPHLHIPLQSGSNKILKLMNRPYTTKYFLNKINDIRKLIPDISITTDVIVGFPSETEKDFKNTYNLSKKIKFSQIHVFPFSAHEKTRAFHLPNQIEKSVIDVRAEILRKLSRGLENSFRKMISHKNLDIIIEKRLKNGNYHGKSKYGLDVELT